MPKLVILRHGRSDWNDKNLFTGWVDVDITAGGAAEARSAGEEMSKAGLLPEILHTSLLTRAIHTAELALNTCGRSWIPVKRHWRLNERHYGGLQGLDKASTKEKHGEELFMTWRRSYDTPPPAIEKGSKFDISCDPRYADLPSEVIPMTECLKDVVERMEPWWVDIAAPDLRTGKTVLVVAHGNSLRALVKKLEGISDEEIAGLNIATGIPRYYELDDDLQITGPGRDLGDQEAIAAKVAEVASQGAKKG